MNDRGVDIYREQEEFHESDVSRRNQKKMEVEGRGSIHSRFSPISSAFGKTGKDVICHVEVVLQIIRILLRN